MAFYYRIVIQLRTAATFIYPDTQTVITQPSLFISRCFKKLTPLRDSIPYRERNAQSISLVTYHLESPTK